MPFNENEKTDTQLTIYEAKKKAIEGMQEGRNSPVYNGGNFSPIMDNPTHQFHKWVSLNLLK